jgi:N-acetylglucosaminyl-diphospho-decaprenol L-rhamnosyltransferase
VSGGPDVSVVIVSYNDRDDVGRCLDSLFRETRGVRQEVFVVDNASADGTPAQVSGRFPEVRVIVNPDNQGFARANNVALRLARGRYMMLLNPDTRLENDAIRLMVAFLDDHPRVWACGPTLLNADGTLQHSLRRFPSVINQLCEAVFLHRLMPRATWAGEVLQDDRLYADTRTVDWLSGAALLVRAEAVEQIGLLDEGYFMYSEETDWCRRAARAGWVTSFVPQARITHMNDQSAQSPALFAMLVDSRRRYFSQNHGAVQATALTLVSGLYLLVRLALWGLIGLVRPGAAGDRVGMYASGLRRLMSADARVAS